MGDILCGNDVIEMNQNFRSLTITVYDGGLLDFLPSLTLLKGCLEKLLQICNKYRGIFFFFISPWAQKNNGPEKVGFKDEDEKYYGCGLTGNEEIVGMVKQLIFFTQIDVNGEKSDKCESVLKIGFYGILSVCD